MPYIYPQLPTYSVMAVFNSISIPFSFKWFSGKSKLKKLHLFKNIPVLIMEEGKLGL
jgi:hypothetical protein